MKCTDVTTKYGIVRGAEEQDLIVWRGIPYAASPVGEFRFLPPQPLECWEGIRDATKFSAIPFQHNDTLLGEPTEAMSEDCLYLDIWSLKSDKKKRPVMVWIYGGGFCSGNSSQSWYDGDMFARNGNVVLVNFNYRLGALGFLYVGQELGDKYAASGNNGLLDQIAALRWVKENIEAFGGDPDNITIFGESAGAFSVGCVLATPLGNGLYNRAILQSGSVGLEPAMEDVAEYTKQFIALMGITKDELLTVSPERMLAAQGISKTLRFWPVIDGVVYSKSFFESLIDNWQKDVAILIGTNLNEANYITEILEPELGKVDFEEGIKLLFTSDPQRVIRVYEDNADETPNSTPWQAFISDLYHRIYVLETAEKMHALGSHVWVYRFDWASRAKGRNLQAAHALELPFMFHHLNEPRAIQYAGDTSNATALADKMQAAWIAFATYGDLHSVEGLPYWPEYDCEKRSIMIFNDECHIVDDPQKSTRMLWKDIDYQERNAVLRLYHDRKWTLAVKK
jgi:para-nitrobenzyl esterase